MQVRLLRSQVRILLWTTISIPPDYENNITAIQIAGRRVAFETPYHIKLSDTIVSKNKL